jgi:hypothetical protein
MTSNEIPSDRYGIISCSTALANRRRSMEIFTVIAFGEWLQENPIFNH